MHLSHRWILFGFVVLFSCSRSLTTVSTSVPEKICHSGILTPDDAAITITGAFFLEKSPQRVVMNRFTEEVLNNDSTFMNPEKARTQAGVCIFLRTNSRKITFHFERRDSSLHRYSLLGVFRNGKLFKKVAVTADNAPDSVAVVNPDPGGELSEWEVVLPGFYGLNFTGITVDKGSRYEKTAPPRTVYVAIGNSITHGTGQAASYQSYPYILARKKKWTLYNLAVGGSRTSWPVATLLKGKKVDVITVLWGYNDWNAGFTKEQERTYYRRLVEELLKAQPEAKIYCITPTFTYRTKPKSGELSLDDLRAVQTEVVGAFRKKGFDNLRLIRGESITDSTYLKPKGSRDVVHFTVEGAAKFAGQLERLVRE